MATRIHKARAKAQVAGKNNAFVSAADRIAHITKAVHQAIANVQDPGKPAPKMMSAAKGVGTPVQPSTVYVAVVYQFDL